MDQGYQILAFGRRRYLDMAVICAKSLRRVDQRPIQLVTDDLAAARDVRRHFTVITPYRGGMSGALAKLTMHEHLVFDQTMYIDSDCVAFRDVDFFWDLLSRDGSVLIGDKKTSGRWYRNNIADWCAHFSIPYVIQTNSGFMFLTGETRKLLEVALGIVRTHGNFTKSNHRGLGPPDEPYLAVAGAPGCVSLATGSRRPDPDAFDQQGEEFSV